MNYITTPYTANYSTHVFHQYTLKLKNVDRYRLIEHMKELGVPVMIYYPVPLHLQKAFAHLGYHKGDFPVTEALCDCVVSLPMHTELDEEQLQFITENFLNAMDQFAN